MRIPLIIAKTNSEHRKSIYRSIQLTEWQLYEPRFTRVRYVKAYVTRRDYLYAYFEPYKIQSAWRYIPSHLLCTYKFARFVFDIYPLDYFTLMDLDPVYLGLSESKEDALVAAITAKKLGVQKGE